MSDKLEIDIDSTSMGSSACMRNFFLTVIGSIEEGKIVGGYKTLPSAAIMYGVAVHRFVDVMYRTGGHYPTARKAAEEVFALPKEAPKEKAGHLGDPKHLITTCYNLWTQKIEEEGEFDVLQIETKCFWCGGKAHRDEDVSTENPLGYCKKCDGTGHRQGPATELTFRIPFYEDDTIIVNLCGTIDRVGQYKGGVFAIRDWKTTSSYKVDEYLSGYDLNRQLRIYTLACKLQAEKYPESTLGQLGKTKMGACIDGIFIKSKANDNEYHSTEVYTFSDEDMREIRFQLVEFCKTLSKHIEFAKSLPSYMPMRDGLLNGTCTNTWGKCKFWNVCKNGGDVANLLLRRDFIRKVYDPLNFNEA